MPGPDPSRNRHNTPLPPGLRYYLVLVGIGGAALVWALGLLIVSSDARRGVPWLLCCFIVVVVAFLVAEAFVALARWPDLAYWMANLYFVCSAIPFSAGVWISIDALMGGGGSLALDAVAVLLLVTLLTYKGGLLHIAWARELLALPLPLVCRSCGYDLRASPHRCPECGLPSHVPPPPVITPPWDGA